MIVATILPATPRGALCASGRKAQEQQRDGEAHRAQRTPPPLEFVLPHLHHPKENHWSEEQQD
jgi:hypothetical protein